MQKMTDGGTDTALRLLVARDSRVSGEEAEWHYCEFHGTPRFRSGYCAARIGQYISDPPRFCRAKETIVPVSPFTLEFRESPGYTENSCICPTAAKESSKYLSTRFRGVLHRPPPFVILVSRYKVGEYHFFPTLLSFYCGFNVFTLSTDADRRLSELISR